ncbi:hypothetical protein Leryth_002394 [Lithospermum erythrorhizon]|nr:hypothetical protein Leryth_002394 [Lithospermum erythrorhizon]
MRSWSVDNNVLKTEINSHHMIVCKMHILPRSLHPNFTRSFVQQLCVLIVSRKIC